MYGMNRHVLRLSPHDPEWAQDFLTEKERIVAALQGPAVEIEHVGSTAIPSVHAKPILDLAILCGERELPLLVHALTELGYEYRGPYGDIDSHHYAVLDRGDIRFCQAHVSTSRDADWYSKLRFREVLRQNPQMAKKYNDYKIELAAIANNKTEYAEIKSQWVDNFMPEVLQAAANLGFN